MTVDLGLPGRELSPEHRQYLIDAGINQSYLDSADCKIRSSSTSAHLRLPPVTGQNPTPWSWVDDPSGILFPWVSVGGEITWQFRPDNPPLDENGRPKKYLFPSASKIRYGVRSDAGGTSPIWIVEGTKQSFSVASYIGDETTIVGIPGCSGWSEGGWSVPTDLIRLVHRRRVYVLLDADATDNPDVYRAGVKISDRLSAAAKELRFIPCPGGDNQGIDDYLSAFDDADRREFLMGLPDTAIAKPAARKPAERTRSRNLLDTKAQQEELAAKRSTTIEAIMQSVTCGSDQTDDEKREARKGNGNLWLRDSGGFAVADLGASIMDSDTPVCRLPG